MDGLDLIELAEGCDDIFEHRFLCRVGDHDEASGGIAVFLAHGAQGHPVAGKDTGDGRKHAGAVFNFPVDVLASFHFSELRNR